jgi:hypothetical protein
MKFLIAFLLMAVLSFSLSLFLPWWVIAPACFLVAVAMQLKPGISFLCGFASLFSMWGWYTLYISSVNEDILAHRLSVLLLNSDNSYMLIFLTALIGGLVGALSALSGSLLFKKK